MTKKKNKTKSTKVKGLKKWNSRGRLQAARDWTRGPVWFCLAGSTDRLQQHRRSHGTELRLNNRHHSTTTVSVPYEEIKATESSVCVVGVQAGGGAGGQVLLPLFESMIVGFHLLHTHTHTPTPLTLPLPPQPSISPLHHFQNEAVVPPRWRREVEAESWDRRDRGG